MKYEQSRTILSAQSVEESIGGKEMELERA